MTDLHNPHDIFFKKFFSDERNVRDFFKQYLPEEILEIIDLRYVKAMPATFVSKSLRDSYADALCEVKLADYKGYIYILCEHKSKSEKDTIFQLLGYLASVYKHLSSKREGVSTCVPYVYPIVIYHGKAKWVHSKRFWDYVQFDRENDELMDAFPNFSYKLYDVCRMKNEEIKGGKTLILFLFLLKLRDAPEEIDRVLEKLKELDDKETYTYMLTYLFAVQEVPDEKIQSHIEKLPGDLKEVTMTVAERLEKKGIEKGEEKNKIKTIITMLKKGFDLKLISEITEAKIDEIKEIQKQLKHS